MTHEVIVIGAGPAGCTAAFHLARAGHRVALLEKTALPRYKTCGGGLVARAVEAMPVSVGAVIERQCHEVVVGLLGRLPAFAARRTTPLISMTMRPALDQLLAQAAADAGADLRAPSPVTALEPEDGSVRVSTPGAALRAPWVIAADGATGVAARAGGWDVARRAIPALEMEAEVDEPTFARFADAARFDFGTPGRGYAWVFPKRAHLSVGILSTQRGTRHLRDDLEAYLRALDISPRAAERHGYVIPIHRAPRPHVRGRIIAVGDAAGLADPLTAEGISSAVLSARFAAEAITRGDSHPVAVRRRYARALRRHVFPWLTVGRALARVVYSPSPLQRAAYRVMGPRVAAAVAELTTGRSRAAPIVCKTLNTNFPENSRPTG